MDADKAEKSFLLLLIPVGLSIVCLVGSQILMPENCFLYDDRNFGQLCHTIPVTEPCPICKDVMTATLARVLFAFGIFSLLLPFAIGLIQARRNSTEETNLFE